MGLSCQGRIPFYIESSKIFVMHVDFYVERDNLSDHVGMGFVGVFVKEDIYYPEKLIEVLNLYKRKLNLHHPTFANLGSTALVLTMTEVTSEEPEQVYYISILHYNSYPYICIGWT